MKLMILLAVCAISSADKLDRTYLPPVSAGSAGGSPGSLQAPSGPGAFSQGRGTPSNEPAFSGQAGFGAAPSPKYGAPSAGNFGGNSAPQQGFSGAGAQGSRGSTGSSQGFGSANSPSYGIGDANSQSQGFTGPSAPNQGISGVSDTQRFPGSNTPSQGYGQTFNGRFNGPSQGLNSANVPTGNYNAPQGFNAGAAAYTQPERAQADQERTAQILRQDFQNDGETFSYSFETSNGISAEESGVATNGVQAQGAFSYTGDDGQVYSVTYTADENGYQPRGDHLPTPPPIPEEILRSIELNRAAAAAGTIGEGAYNEQYDESPTQQYNAPSGPSGPQQQYGAPQQYSGNQLSGQPEPQQASQYNAPKPGGFVQQPARPQYQAFGQQNAAPGQGPSQFTGAQQNNGPQAFSVPQQFNTRGSAPSQQYGAPQGSSRQQSAPQGPSQQYRAPQGSSQQQAASQGPSQQYNAPQGSSQQYSGPQGSSQQYNRGQQNAGPSQQYNGGQGASGPRGAAPLQQYGAPAPQAGSQSGMSRQQYSGAPYSYNQPAAGSPPRSGAGIGSAPQYNPLATQTFNGNAGAASAGVRPAGSSPATAGFPAARQPPSFSQQDGYQY